MYTRETSSKQAPAYHRPALTNANSQNDNQEALNWIHTETSVEASNLNLNPKFSESLNDSFAPRKLPHLMVSHSKGPFHRMTETEYLIGWTNGFFAAGFINDTQKCANIKTTPLLCQFGNCKSEEQKKLHVGSIVAVRAYARIIDRGGIKFKDMIYSDSQWNKFFEGGFPKPSVMASEWRIIEEPTIVRSIGSLTKFSPAFNTENGTMRYEGEVTDQENSIVLKITDEMFIMTPKNKLPAEKSGFVLTWIQLKGPCAAFKPKSNRYTMLPDWMMGKYKEVERFADEFWLENVSNIFV